MEASLALGLARRLGILPANNLQAGQELCSQFFYAARASRAGFAQLLHDFWGGKQQRGDYDSDAIAGFADCLSDFAPADNACHAFFEREKALSMTIDEVEAIWEPIAASDDWSALHQKIDSVRELGEALTL